MNTQSTSTEKPSTKTKTKERVVMGQQAMDFIQHGTAASMEVVTPLGRRFNFKSNFIGFDDQQHIYFTLPKISKIEYEEFFVDGFNVDIEGISEQAEGTLVRFRSRIEHVIIRPVQVLVLSVPQEAKLALLRNELRYELQLSGDIQLSARKLNVLLTDVSAGGCGFTYDAISPVFEVAQKIVLEVSNTTTEDIYALSGAIKNGRKKRGRQIYGMIFDEPGKANCRRLLSTLVYDGTKYVFKNARKNQSIGD